MKQFSELTEQEKQFYLDLVVSNLAGLYIEGVKEDGKLVYNCVENLYNFIQASQVDISLSESLGKDEMYCNWYQCPKCKDKNIVIYSKFCSNCGVKLNWIN